MLGLYIISNNIINIGIINESNVLFIKVFLSLQVKIENKYVNKIPKFNIPLESFIKNNKIINRYANKQYIIFLYSTSTKSNKTIVNDT